LLLAVAGLVATIAGLANSGSDHLAGTFTLLGYDMNESSGRIFLYGTILGAIGMLGLNMLLAGIGRGLKSRVHSRQERKTEKKQASQMTQERDQLAHELQTERSANRGGERVDVRDKTTETGGRHYHPPG